VYTPANLLRPLQLGEAPVIALNSSSFGRYLAADDPRIMQFALKYQF
jgi:hypothetical protein